MSSNQSNSTDCLKFDEKQITVTVAVRAAIGSLAFVGCLLVILSMVWFKIHKKYVYRLMMYFMVANLLQSTAQVLGVIPIDYDYDEEIASVREGWETACAAFGFINEVSMWMSNCMIVWIVFYLQSSVQRITNGYRFRIQYYQHVNISQSKGWEMCRLLLVFLLPVALNWIPFIWNMYGISGLFCWIKLAPNDNCSDRHLSTILMFALSYGPLLFLLFYSFCSLFVIIAILLWSIKTYRNLIFIKRILKIAASRTATLVVILLVYSSLFAVTIANHLYSIVYPNDHPVYPLWLASAIASPGQILLIFPIAVAWKTLGELRHDPKHDYEVNENTHTRTPATFNSSTHSEVSVQGQQVSAVSAGSYASYIVEPELDDIVQPLVIEGEASCETSYEEVR